MLKTKKHSLIIGFITLIIFAAIGIASLFVTNVTYAASIENTDNLNFTIVTGSGGEQSYSVAVKAAAKPTVETVIIPDTYNGLPVTEIANNGFMSCANLKKAVLPTTVKKIGSNAFMNCAKLERISLPGIESIGMNAFAMCPLLDRTYIPNTVKSVGANILRNNSNTVYVQSSIDEVNSEWQSTWNSYFTGEVVYGISPEETVGYREVKDTQGENVIGYEVVEYQFITDVNANVVIYNSFRSDENSAYLPVFNICSEAFTFTQVNSITLKDRRTDDSSAPEFTHLINIRSNAFLAFLGNEVSIEVGVSFNHPADLQNTSESMYDNSPIVGDSNNKSVKIFEESTVKSVTLPNNVDFIAERMFYNCAYLENIKYSGQVYEGVNILNSVSKIGSEAFSSCVSLLNLTIPSSVIEVGEAVFYAWGDGENSQTINVDFYEGYLPGGWADNWFEGNGEKTSIAYKALTYIVIDWQDEAGTKQVVGVKPGLEMPSITAIENNGYEFKGIYSEQRGNGLQYYTNNLQARKPWIAGEPTTIYAYWEIITYDIIYPAELNGYVGANATSYTVNDDITITPIEYKGYLYTFAPDRIEKGTIGNITLDITKSPQNYYINYEVELKGNINNNPTMYNITQEIVFENLVCEGYSFSWSPSGIPKGSTGEITVTGTWTPNEYAITYNVSKDTQHSNPATYTYGQELVLEPATRNGYFVSWDTPKIPTGTIGEITVKAIYTEKSIEQCYNNGIYEIWTRGQLESIKNQPNGGYGRTYRLMQKVSGDYYSTSYWTPISEFKGTFDGNGFSVTNYYIETTSGSNFGFCRINSGTIKNFKLGVRFNVGAEFSNVNVGAFAGINKGTITNCSITAVYVRPFFRCFAKGDSYMGGFVGVNEGTIDGCTSGDWLDGSCNMGTIAGKNSGTIKNCDISDGYIEFTYSDYNACVGGIVGLQVSGSVTNCNFQGKIVWGNYNSETYPNRTENREMQPCMGIMIGYKQGGTISGSSWADTSGGQGKIVVSFSTPSIVEWTTGSLWWQETHTHDQGLYFKNEECGKIS